MSKILKGSLVAATLFGLGACDIPIIRDERGEFRNYVFNVTAHIRDGVTPIDTQRDPNTKTTVYTFYGEGNAAARKVRIERPGTDTTIVVIGSPSVGYALITNGGCSAATNSIYALYKDGCRYLNERDAYSIYKTVVTFDQAQPKKS